MKLNRTPREFLAATDSQELGELFAYFTLQEEDRVAEREAEQTQEAESGFKKAIAKNP